MPSFIKRAVFVQFHNYLLILKVAANNGAYNEYKL